MDTKKLLNFFTFSGKFSFFLFFLGILLWVSLSWIRFYWVGNLKLDDIELSQLQRAFLTVGWLVGLFSCFAGYWSLVRSSVLPSFARLFWIAFSCFFVVSLSLPFTSNDIFSNLAYGEMAHKRLLFYREGPLALGVDNSFLHFVGNHWKSVPMIYGPLLAQLNFWAVNSDSVIQSVIYFKVLSLFISWGILGALVLLCKSRFESNLACRYFFWIAFNPLLIWELPGQAHNDAWMILMIVLFLYFALSQKVISALSCLLIGFFAKYAVLPILGLYLWFQIRANGWVGFKKIIIFLLMVSLVFFIFNFNFEWWKGLRFALSGDWHFISNSFLYFIYYTLLQSPDLRDLVKRVYGVLATVLLALTVIRAIYLTRKIEDVLEQSLFFFLVYFLIASPNVQQWYYLWIFPLVLVLAKPGWKIFMVLATFLLLFIYGFNGVVSSFLWSFLNLILMGWIWKNRLFAPSKLEKLDRISI